MHTVCTGTLEVRFSEDAWCAANMEASGVTLVLLKFKVSDQPLWVHLGTFTDPQADPQEAGRGGPSIVPCEETGLWGRAEQNDVEWRSGSCHRPAALSALFSGTRRPLLPGHSPPHPLCFSVFLLPKYQRNFI